MNQKLINKDNLPTFGFTLVELLVGIALSSLIFMAISTLMLVLFSSSSRVAQMDRLEQTQNDLQAELSNAIRWADQVDVTDSARIKVYHESEETEYYIEEGRLYKKTSTAMQVLTSQDVLINSLTAVNYSTASFGEPDPKVSLNITIEMQDKQFFHVLDTVNLVVSQRSSIVKDSP